MEGDEPLPDDLRCRRTDGRDWRCKRRVFDGTSSCLNHLYRGRLNPPSFPTIGIRVKLESVHGAPELLSGANHPFPVPETKEKQLQTSSPKKRRKISPPVENLRCSGTDGRGRCQRQVLEGGSLCEIHLKRAQQSPKKLNVMEINLESETLKEKGGEGTPLVVKQNEKAKGAGGTPLLEGEGDDIRCKRTDGRAWRCKMKVLEGKTMCEFHFKQGRLRNKRVLEPESFKIKRVKGGEEKIEKRLKKKRELKVLENDSGKGMMCMKEDLIRVFLTRETMESSKKGDKSSVEVTKDLPYGFMAIPPTPSTQLVGNVESLGIKVGVQCSKSTVTRRIRSKNIVPPPISSLKVVPYAGNLGKLKNNGRKKCHWCRCSENKNLTKCLTCRKRLFSSDCMKKRCADPKEVKLQCPVCRESCECKFCKKNTKSKDVVTKEMLKDRYAESKLRQLKYLINFLLPILVKINQVQSVEVEMEAKFKGQSVSDIDIQQADMGCSDSCCCNNCKNPILDFHRSCPNCSYSLCLSCCQEYTQGGWLVGQTGVKNKTQTCLPAVMSSNKLQKETYTQSAESDDLPASHLHISCHKDGFQVRFLDLRCIFPLNWTKELEISAREMVSECDFLQTRDNTGECLLCAGMSDANKSRELKEASRREGSEDNFLFHPIFSDDHEALVAHFQKHWQKGQPVIVHHVLQDSSSLSWNPLAMFYRYLEMATRSEHAKEFETASCADWYDVEIGVKESFTRLSGKEFVCKRRESLRLKAKLSSALSHKLFESNYLGIIKALPFQEYTNPRSGLLNLAGKLPEDFMDSKLGPHLCISFESREEISLGKLVTNLCCNSYDAVNVLVHAGESPCSTELMGNIKKLMQNDPNDKEGHCVENVEMNSLSQGVRDSCAGATNANIRIDRPAKVQCSDSDSDASMICSGAHNNPEKQIEQIPHVDLTETTNLSDKRRPMDLCGAQWDVFRRQDIPKLMEYISKHVVEFNHGSDLPKNVVHPIFDGSLYLDVAHKLRLKEDFDVEPWTFNQCLGEAVFIPAGCPYQMKNIKSCVNVVVGFVSPENASECIKLMDEIRVLPNDHKEKQQKLQVEKMTISNIDEAIKEMYRLESQIHNPPVN